MAATTGDIEKSILTELYEGRSENPTAFQKFRGDDDFGEAAVDELFEDLMDRQIIRGNVGERNVQLTADGIEYVEEEYPDIVGN